MDLEENVSKPQEEENQNVSHQDPEDLIYLCSGYCVPQGYRRKSVSTIRKCKKLKLIDITFSKEGSSGKDLEAMKIDFYMQNLNPFCENNSLRKSWLQDDIAHGLKWCTGLDVLYYDQNLVCELMGKRKEFSEDYLRDMFVQDLYLEFFRPKVM